MWRMRAAWPMQLGMPYYVFNYNGCASVSRSWRALPRAYEHGATPNPCLDCNRYLKFGLAGRHAPARSGATCWRHRALCPRRAAAGRALHAQKGRGRQQRIRAMCSHWLTQEQLAHTRFPLGASAQDRGTGDRRGAWLLQTRSKHDSQDICFVPDGDYARRRSSG